MDDMYEIAQQAKCKFFVIDKVQKIGNGWNVRN